jgi:hypothetical protein
MSVGTQDARPPPRPLSGPVQVSRDEEAGKTLEVDLLDGIVPHDLPTVDDGVRWGLRRHRPQSERNTHCGAQVVGSLMPLLGSGTWLKRKIPVEILERF